MYHDKDSLYLLQYRFNRPWKTVVQKCGWRERSASTKITIRTTCFTMCFQSRFNSMFILAVSLNSTPMPHFRKRALLECVTVKNGRLCCKPFEGWSCSLSHPLKCWGFSRSIDVCEWLSPLLCMCACVHSSIRMGAVGEKASYYLPHRVRCQIVKMYYKWSNALFICEFVLLRF